MNDAVHIEILNKLCERLNEENITKVLDAGSGRTSLNFLTKKFSETIIDAIIYPGDKRKRESIDNKVINSNYNLVELDICKEKIKKEYDLVVAHLLLGEATMFNNDFDNLLKKLFSIKTKYLIIIDIPEDPLVNFATIEKLSEKTGTIVSKEQIPMVEGYKGFKSYKGYIIKKNG